MRRLVLPFLVCCSASGPACADGPTALTLQQLMQSAPGPALPAGTVGSVGGDTSATVATAAAAGAVARRWKDRLVERLDVADFGTTADATTAFLSQAAPAGSSLLVLGAAAVPAVGRTVIGSGIPSGTTVAAVSDVAGIVSVALSAPTTAADGIGTQIDFGTHDDTAAFSAALAAATAPAQIYVPPGRYWLTGYPGNVSGVSWVAQGASFTQGGGIAEQGDQSIMQQPGGAALEVVKRMVSPSGEEGIFLPVTADPSLTTASFQKNALHVVLTQNDPSAYGFLGDAATATHDLVGVSVQAHCPGANTRCSLFGSNWINFLDAGSDGPTIINETQVIDNRAAGVPEMDTWDTVGAVDYIMGGTSPATNAIVIQGNAGSGFGAYDGIVFRTGTVGNKLLVERAAGTRDSGGIVHTHSDTLWLGADGGVFAQTLHVGGGLAVANVLPSAGLSVDPNGNLTAPAVSATAVTATQLVAGSARISAETVSTQSAAYTVAASDCGTAIRDTGAAAHGYTVAAGLPVGCRIDIIQAGAGAVTIAAAAGETVEAYKNASATIGQFARAQILVDSATSFSLSGQVQ